MLIMGIDPGSRVLGFAIAKLNSELIEIQQMGVIQTQSPSFYGRLAEIRETLTKMLAQYNPDLLVVEKIFLGKSAESAFKLGHARGVVLAEAALRGIATVEYATRFVKKSVTGNGGSDKTSVRAYLSKYFKISDRLIADDAFDALALVFAEHQNQTARSKKVLEVSP